MPRPSSPRALALALAASLALTACTSANHRRGLMVLGGGAVFMGSVVAIGGSVCDEVANGDKSCEADNDVVEGLGLIGLGLVIGGIGAYLHYVQDKGDK